MGAIRQFLRRAAAHPRWLALLLGGVSACGFQPLALWPLTLLALAGLIELIARAANWKQAALTGWLFGVAHFTVGNGWIATAFTYQSNMPAWLGWIAVVVLSLYLAVYPALAALGPRLIGGNAGRNLALVLAFAGCWIVSEWLRSWVFTGFAWNPLGIVLLGSYRAQGLALVAPLTGTYGLAGLAILLAGALRFGVELALRPDLRARIAGVAGIAGCALAVAIPAQIHYAPMIGVPTNRPFSLVQPGIRQEVLNDPAHFERNFAKTASLTQGRPRGEALVLWPESGVQDYLRDGYPADFYWDSTWAGDPEAARLRIARAAGAGGLLVTGATDLEIGPAPGGGRKVTGARNVFTVLDDSGAIRATYAKAHLVPYGEYLPMRPVLEPLGLSRLVPGSLDFVPGPGPRTIDLGRFGKAGMQICYEIIFSGQVIDRANRPDFIFNGSNDGWFGAWGPPQHLAQARLRAIEEGLPVLRATTNGISAVIDAWGNVEAAIPNNRSGRIDSLIPAARPATPFARLGNALPLGWATVLLVLSLVATRRRRR